MRNGRQSAGIDLIQQLVRIAGVGIEFEYPVQRSASFGDSARVQICLAKVLNGLCALGKIAVFSFDVEATSDLDGPRLAGRGDEWARAAIPDLLHVIPDLPHVIPDPLHVIPDRDPGSNRRGTHLGPQWTPARRPG
jgi:hypothetical protein